jgi:hypothetical protein
MTIERDDYLLVESDCDIAEPDASLWDYDVVDVHDESDIEETEEEIAHHKAELEQEAQAKTTCAQSQATHAICA